MLFEIRHVTSYTFSRPVFLEPHVVRLRPRCDAFQSLDEHSLAVTPQPAGRSDGYDAEGNQAAYLWFEELTPSLEVMAVSTVRTLRPNPFDYLLTHPGAARLPASYPAGEEDSLAPYRRTAGAEPVSALAADLLERAGGDTFAFLVELNGLLYRDWKVVVREEGDPLGAEETLIRGEASCRDLTMLFMEVCREVGLACRFVSGYQQGDPDQATRYMHAWPEVYLPGAGWRGYDPTLGLVVSDRHVALAASSVPQCAAPTQGTFRGSGISSTMEVHLTIEVTGGSP